MNVIEIIRLAIGIAVVCVVGWFVLAGIFALSFFVILPLLVIGALVYSFMMWRYKKLLNEITVGEVGVVVQRIDPEQVGKVLFKRNIATGGMAFDVNVEQDARAMTYIEVGESVCVEEARSGLVFVKRMGE